MSKKFDVIVIGSGPGGYVAAIRCAQLGFKTALVEKYSTLGGTCLNVGCIPSKALLDSSEHYHNAAHQFEEHGIGVGDLSLDFGAMVKRKNGVVEMTTKGIEGLMAKNKIEVIQGLGSFIDAKTVEVKGEKTETITGDKIIIATGSKPSSLPGVTADKERIITSTEALSLKEIPKDLLIIGAGVIGLELGSVYSRLGSNVQVIEYADRLLPTMDKDCGKQLQRTLKKGGMKFTYNVAVQSAEAKGKQVKVLAKANKDGKEVEFTGDYLLVATGRTAYTDGLSLEKIGIETDKFGKIAVNEKLETSVPGVYAIGDVIAGPMLAHKAEEEGVFVAEALANQKPHLNYNLIPGVVYTWPEVAAVGKTEEQLKADGVAYKTGNFPFKASGRARAAGETDGIVKVLADTTTDEILGIHMVGPRCADLIGEAVVAMEYRASAEDLARICHAHPTFSEAIKEAALAATENRAIHM